MVLLAASLGWAGCSTTRNWPRTGDPIVDGQTAIEQGPARDRVLWRYRTAVTAMRLGQYELAANLLEDALFSLNGMFTPDKNAERARGVFSREDRKTFLGEPYERAMAYYYRGILYWMDGEPDNARACFRSAQLEDADLINHEYSNDFALMEHLEGWTTATLGGDGSDAFSRAAKVQRMGPLQPFDSEANVLFFVEMGQGPVKYATGEYAEQLRFKSGHSSSTSVRIRVDGQIIDAPAIDDLSYQATTRGGRVMDHILANKAVFKGATEAAGTAAIFGGAIMASQSSSNAARNAGYGLMLAGLVTSIVSAIATPQADTRTWENLPNLLGFAAARLKPGRYEASVEFLGPGGNPVVGPDRRVAFDVNDPPRNTVVFISERSQ